MKRYGILVTTPHEQTGWVVLEGAVRSRDKIVPVKPMQIGKKDEATPMNFKQADNFAKDKLKGFPKVKVKRLKGGRNARSLPQFQQN